MIATGIAPPPSATFRDYLHSLPDELLESVTEDYSWLASLAFHDGARSAEFRRRRQWCREECARRGVLLGALS
jgi:hypothetical protein